MTKFYRFVMKYLRWLIYVLFFLHVEHKNYIPTDRNFIIISNHISAWDPLTVAAAGKFYVRPMAKKELYKNPIVAFFLEKLGCIKVDRADGARALALARKSLDNKETMLIFPEGTRSKTLKLLEFKAGAFALAIKTDTPILPCQIIAPKGARIFHKITIRFGPVIDPKDIDFAPDDRHYEKAMALVREELIKLRGNDMPN